MDDYVRRLQHDGHTVFVVEDGAPTHTANWSQTFKKLFIGTCVKSVRDIYPRHLRILPAGLFGSKW